MGSRGHLLLAVLAVPLGGGDHWHMLRYGDTPANEISFSEKELRISVKSSASPLFYRFDEPLTLRSLAAEGEASALPQLPPTKEEGSPGADDFTLRLGVVMEGEEKLGWLQRLFAPGWLKRLTEILPDRAFGGVRFLTLSQKLPVGTARRHPKSKHLQEEVARQLASAGPFSFEKTFDPDIRSLGLWVQADGDDTDSSFEVRLRSITVTTVGGESPTSPR
jgi:hypothetical protein